MHHMKEFATAAGTLAIAIGIGFVMQSSESASEHYGEAARPYTVETPYKKMPVRTADAGSSLNGVVSADILSQVRDVKLTSANDAMEASISAGIAHVEHASGELFRPVSEPPASQQCEVTARATAIPGALVNLDLEAPCVPNERLTVHHNGMVFTEKTDDAGKLDITVPALAEQAVFIMAFANGDGTVAQATIPDIADFYRILLQWRGQSGFELHAREFGAGYDEPGHIWSGTGQNIAGFIAGLNGVMFQLGDYMSAEPLVAQVYTFPKLYSKNSGVVDLSIEVEVTTANCDLEIEAQSLEFLSDRQVKTQDLTLAVPNCTAVGSFLVLNNLVSDMTVARN